MSDTSQSTKCPVCGTTASIHPNVGGGFYVISCARCGSYEFGNISQLEISNWTSQQRINLSGWIRENQNCRIVSYNLRQLSNLRNLSVGEKAEKVLERLASKFPKPGEWLDLSGGAHLEFLSIGRAVDNAELRFLMREYLHREMGFLILQELQTAFDVEENYKISPKGWAHLDSLRYGNPDSQIGFVAMWFDKSVDPAYMAIEAGIRNSGYEPLRIDRQEHNNKIDNEIVAGIRRSKFLVAVYRSSRRSLF